jgi:hypothetical protein
MEAKRQNVWQEIRFHGRFGDLVLLIHPWKRGWAILFAEDMYGHSGYLLEKVAVGAAKKVVPHLIKELDKIFADHGSVKSIPDHVFQYAQDLLGWFEGKMMAESNWKEYNIPFPRPVRSAPISHEEAPEQLSLGLSLSDADRAEGFEEVG